MEVSWRHQAGWIVGCLGQGSEGWGQIQQQWQKLRRVRAALGSLQDKDEATRVSRMKHWGVRGMEGSSEEIRFNGSGRSNAACESGFGAAALGG